jgi:hypothetical protein
MVPFELGGGGGWGGEFIKGPRGDLSHKGVRGVWEGGGKGRQASMFAFSTALDREIFWSTPSKSDSDSCPRPAPPAAHASGKHSR